jgi:hypothetical protein
LFVCSAASNADQGFDRDPRRTGLRDGSTLAGEAGKTMSEVTLAVVRETGTMAEIAAASTEHSRGIEQVNLAITGSPAGFTTNVYTRRTLTPRVSRLRAA